MPTRRPRLRFHNQDRESRFLAALLPSAHGQSHAPAENEAAQRKTRTLRASRRRRAQAPARRGRAARRTATIAPEHLAALPENSVWRDAVFPALETRTRKRRRQNVSRKKQERSTTSRS